MEQKLKWGVPLGAFSAGLLIFAMAAYGRAQTIVSEPYVPPAATQASGQQFSPQAQAGEVGVVAITTAPWKTNTPLVLDLNNSGVIEGGENFGPYTVYNWNDALRFSWADQPFEAAVPNASYRVSIRQFPLGEPVFSGQYTEFKVAHHWATPDQPGNSYEIGSIGFGERICFGCLTVVTVIPEVYTTDYNPATFNTSYTYQALDGAGGFDSTPFYSAPFVFERVPRSGTGNDFQCEPPTEFEEDTFFYENEDGDCLCNIDPSQELTNVECILLEVEEDLEDDQDEDFEDDELVGPGTLETRDDGRCYCDFVD